MTRRRIWTIGGLALLGVWAVAGIAILVARSQRQKFRHQDDLRAMFEKMTPAERLRYLDLTLPRGMKQMMEAFNKMEPDKRRQLVNRAVNDLTRARDEAGPKDQDRLRTSLNDQTTQKIINEGMKSFLSDATAETKLDLQPLIEQMQTLLQTGH